MISRCYRAKQVIDRTEVDRLLETWLREQARGVGDTTARRDDLSSTTVDSIGVELEEYD